MPRIVLPAVYIMANRLNGTLYTGVTSDLIRRVWEHRNEFCSGFAKSHKLKLLVYYENHPTMENAICREKQLKKWNRLWKLKLINDFNPEWRDLYDLIRGFE